MFRRMIRDLRFWLFVPFIAVFVFGSIQATAAAVPNWAIPWVVGGTLFVAVLAAPWFLMRIGLWFLVSVFKVLDRSGWG